MIVEPLSRQGHSLVDDNNVEAEFLYFFKELYTKPGNQTLPLIDNWDPINVDSAIALEAPFTEEEI